MPTTATFFVTGATGKLGGLVINSLLERVSAGAVVVGMRDPTKDVCTANALRCSMTAAS